MILYLKAMQLPPHRCDPPCGHRDGSRWPNTSGSLRWGGSCLASR